MSDDDRFNVKGMNDLKDSGKADLKIDAPTRNAYVQAIGDFKDKIDEAAKKVDDLPDYGEPGTLGSAQSTKRHLQSDVNKMKKCLHDYSTYLDAFGDTVKKACDRTMDAG